MAMNAAGAFVIPWLDCDVDGVPGADISALEPGTQLSWRGTPLRLDGPQGILPLGRSLESARRRRALDVELDEDRAAPPLAGPGFALTDGRSLWAFSLIEGRSGRGPLCLTLDGCPPCDRPLWVVRASVMANAAQQTRPRGVVCFTPGTMISTPNGPRPVEQICEGDLIDTKDNGPQEVLWRGERHLTGAGLHAQPGLAPIRLRRGALGVDVPDHALLVSPDHRLVLRGARARTLFHSDEVLVPARDLIDGQAVARVQGLRRLSYVHLALPSHQIVFANGVETESFDPTATSLTAIPAPDRARLMERLPQLADAPTGYGGPARRVLTRGETAILRRDAGLH